MSTYIESKADGAGAKSEAKAVRRFTADLSAVGEPALWAFGGALALGIILVTGFLLAIFWNGVSTFWPKPIEVVTLKDGTWVAGEPSRVNLYRLEPNVLAAMPEAARDEIERNDGYVRRNLYRIGNYDLYNEDFRWVSDFSVARRERPADLYFVERLEWGPFVGRIASLTRSEERRVGKSV